MALNLEGGGGGESIILVVVINGKKGLSLADRRYKFYMLLALDLTKKSPISLFYPSQMTFRPPPPVYESLQMSGPNK